MRSSGRRSPEGSGVEGDRATVVPRLPGELVELTRRETPDDLDAFVDEVFGSPDDSGPGIADVVLIIGGVCAVVASLMTGLPRVVLVLGALSLGLGCILPLRWLSQRFE